MVELDSLINNLSKDSLYNWNHNYLKNNKKRYQFDLELIKSHYVSGEILEIGSAPFHLTYLLKNKKYPIIGVDIAPERFKHFINDHSLRVIKCDIENESLPFDNNEFGFVLFNEIFEHLRINPIATLKEINRILKPSGKLILSTPNLYSINNNINFLLGKGFDDPYKEFMKLYNLGHMGHTRLYSVKQMKTFLENTGFKSDKVLYKSYNMLKGLWFPFNFVKKIFPQFRTYQIHICKKHIK